MAITAGGAHSCALLDNHTVRCWGHGFNGALGYGGDPNNSDPMLHPQDIGNDETPGSIPPVNLGAGRTATAISAGQSHTCALLDDNSVRCWGSAQDAQLGLGTPAPDGSPKNVADPSTAGPVDLGPGHTAVAISAGALHTCAVLDEGSVRCWGSGAQGRLGYGNQRTIGDDETPGSVPPVNLGPGRTALAISAGDDHTCARLDNHTVRCWGFGLYGQLGYGTTETIGDNEAPGSVGPVNLGSARTALAVSAGDRHTCARLDDTTVSCWGYGGNGRLGYGNERNLGDDETPCTVGPVPLDVALVTPSAAYPGCAPSVQIGPGPGRGRPSGYPLSPLAAEAKRRRALRGCLAKAARHARRETRRGRRGASREHARLERHVKRHHRRKRRACLKRYGRTPGPVTGLTARAPSQRTIVLTFKAPGSDGSRPPAARTYLVKQSRRPIPDKQTFRAAQTLCKGRCRFPALTTVGGEVTLTVTDLRPHTTYHYAVAARDNVSHTLGQRSREVKARTR